MRQGFGKDFKGMPRFLPMIAACLLLGLPAAAKADTTGDEQPAADEGSHYDLGYRVYVGGMLSLRADVRMARGADSYLLHADASTAGMIGRVLPWQGDITSRGAVAGGRLRPESFELISHDGDDDKRQNISYGPEGQVEYHSWKNGEPRDQGPLRVPQEAAAGSFDLFSGILAATENGCAGSVPVFDGKRIFNLVLSDGGEEILEPSRYSAFSGPAELCRITLGEGPGFTDRDRRRYLFKSYGEGGERGPISVWLATPPDSGRPLPVRIRFSTPFGAALAHLATIRRSEESAQLGGAE
jgi:hypothetical protein